MSDLTHDRWREHARDGKEAWVQINEARRDAQNSAINAARAHLIVEAIKEKATQWAALTPKGEWGDDLPSTIYGDVGRELLGIIEHPVPAAAPFTEPEVPDDEI